MIHVLNNFEKCLLKNKLVFILILVLFLLNSLIQVSAFATWEQELNKISHDQRYLLLTAKERKQEFDRYTHG